MLTYQVKSLIKDPGLSLPVHEVLEQEELILGGERVRFLTPVTIDGALRHIGGWIIEFKGTLALYRWPAAAAQRQPMSPCIATSHSDTLQTGRKTNPVIMMSRSIRTKSSI